MRCSLAIVGVVACGRLGFDAVPGAGADGGHGGDGADGASQGGPALVQSQSMFSMGTTTPQLPVSPTLRGDLLVVLTADVGDQTPLGTLDDSVGDVFVSANATFTEGSSFGEVWYSDSGIGGATSVTLGDAVAHNRDVWIVELSGVSQLDTVLAVSDQAYSATASAPSVTPTREPAAIVSIMQLTQAVQTVTAPFTLLDVVMGDGAAVAIVGTAGSYGPTFTINMPGTYGAATVAFIAP